MYVIVWYSHGSKAGTAFHPSEVDKMKNIHAFYTFNHAHIFMAIIPIYRQLAILKPSIYT